MRKPKFPDTLDAMALLIVEEIDDRALAIMAAESGASMVEARDTAFKQTRAQLYNTWARSGDGAAEELYMKLWCDEMEFRREAGKKRRGAR